MPIQYQKHYTRADLRANLDKLYVFGDNLAQWGLGGQAAAARDEPNAVGLATKKSPHEYACDADLDLYVSNYAKGYARLYAHIAQGGAVVWPADGIGTGLADLENRAPKIWALLQASIKVFIEAAEEASYSCEP